MYDIISWLIYFDKKSGSFIFKIENRLRKRVLSHTNKITSDKLGAAFHFPHGVANALLINEVIKFNATESPKKMGTFSQYKYPKAIERYGEIASFVGIDGKNDADKTKKLIEAIDELKTKIGIKKFIKDYNISEEDFLAQLDNMVEQAFDDQCTGANPRYPLMDEMKKMYLSAYDGRS